MAQAPSSQSPPERASDTTKVIYVMGAARSGSTILGVTLGNCAGVFYSGELRGWLETDGVPGVGGQERLRFWSEVREEVEPPADLAGREAQHIERVVSLLHPRQYSQRRRLTNHYREVAGELFRSVARVAGVGCVVDSSSYPLRARELRKLEGIDVYLIYLVRNPHNVVASFTGPEWPFSRSTFATNAYLWLTTLLSIVVFLTHKRERRVFVRHEEFIADPQAVLRRILDCAQLDVPLPNLEALDTGIHYGGNHRLRSGEVIALRRSPERAPRRLLMTTIMQLAWRPILALLRPQAKISRRSGTLTAEQSLRTDHASS